MERVYALVKCWYERYTIDDQEWQEFCTAMLEALMEKNQDVLKRLKEIKQYRVNRYFFIWVYTLTG